MAGKRKTVQPHQGRGVELGHAGLHAEEHIAHGLRGVRADEVESGDLVSLVSGAKASLRVHEQGIGVADRGAAAGDLAQRVGEIGWDFESESVAVPLAGAEVLPSRRADPRSPGDSRRGKDVGEGGALAARLPEQAEALELHDLEVVIDRTDPGVAQSLVAHEELGPSRSGVEADDEERFLEPGVVAGEVRKVREMLPVRIDDDVRESMRPGLIGEQVEPAPVQRRRDGRLCHRQSELGQVQGVKPCTHRVHPSYESGSYPAVALHRKQSTR